MEILHARIEEFMKPMASPSKTSISISTQPSSQKNVKIKKSDTTAGTTDESTTKEKGKAKALTDGTPIEPCSSIPLEPPLDLMNFLHPPYGHFELTSIVSIVNERVLKKYEGSDSPTSSTNEETENEISEERVVLTIGHPREKLPSSTQNQKEIILHGASAKEDQETRKQELMSLMLNQSLPSHPN